MLQTDSHCAVLSAIRTAFGAICIETVSLRKTIIGDLSVYFLRMSAGMRACYPMAVRIRHVSNLQKEKVLEYYRVYWDPFRESVAERRFRTAA